ncbi:MAG: HEAT repeat domain-containing protein [Phycisphaerales bacterium]|nr:MAG: HEAT repeat domain-containing protein [Phycisphaerales bacterium]
MFKGKSFATILILAFLCAGITVGETLDDNWNDYLHYTMIGRFDLAKGYAQAILQSNPDPVKLLALSRANPEGYALLLRVKDVAPDPELAELTGKICDYIEKGTLTRRADSAIIAGEVRRLSTTDRGWLMAVKRLREAGEYAVPFMLDALADNSRKAEFPNIIRALPHVGRDAIRPLAAGLQTTNIAVKDEIIKAMGKIGYPQSAPYLKYVVERDASAALRASAQASLKQIDPAVLRAPAALLFYQLAEKYYYHSESLAPAEDADFANVWFWDVTAGRPVREEVDRAYFYELMAMRCCEWALRADPGLGKAIGLWIAAFFKAESAGLEMPAYFGRGHADALVYATTAGVEYLHQALARAVKDKNAYVALGVVEALATTAGEKSLLYRIGPEQPLVGALSFESRPVRYSAAIAIAAAGPKDNFPQSKLVARILAEALSRAPEAAEDQGLWNQQIADSYALRAAKVMLSLAESRNLVIDLSLAQGALVGAIDDMNPEIQILTGRTLAHLASPNAQRAIAAMALSENNSLEVRVAAFESLASSAKLNANMLVDQMLDGIYALISSTATDEGLRSAAAAAYGALNLPSEKVKDLILDQAKS